MNLFLDLVVPNAVGGLLNLASRSWSDGAVDDRQRGLVLEDIARRRSDKVRDLEREAEMQDGTGFGDFHRLNVHSHAFILPAQDARKRPAYLTHACHNDDAIFGQVETSC